ncbi:hypothetical protein BGX21_008836 [Mortierella sp. AD011]|nr:hypothetical protein BGX20_009208 [Mortierella sp. AD010]KAF9402763.1 hypothetical protein BGX21_008836 [Mortierella sp. AD011]
MTTFAIRIAYLRRTCHLHNLGRTAWIYWPTQLCMAIAGSLGLATSVLTFMQSDSSPAAAFGYICLGIGWLTAVALNYEEHMYKIRSSDFILMFYTFSIASCLIVLYPGAEEAGNNDPQFKVTVAITVCLAIGFVIESWPRNGTRVQKLSGASAYDKANIFSRSTMEFFQPIMSLSLKRSITMDDLQNQLPENISSSSCHDSLERQWRRNVEKWNYQRQLGSNTREGESKAKISLFWTIIQVRARSMIPILFFRTVRPLLLFSIPGLLSILLEYLQDARTEKAKSLSYGLLIAGAIFSAAFVGAIIQAVSRQYSIQLGFQTRVALISMVYRKSLRLSPKSKTKSTTGEIVNHMSVDADSWTEGFVYISMWVSLPIEISTAMWLLYRLLGWSFLAGIAALVAMTPLQVYRARVYNTLKKNKLSVMDERVRLTTECLAAIKVVKLYCWQSAFKEKILEVRDRELEAMRQLGLIYSLMSIIFTSSTLIICLLTLSVYATWGGEGFTNGKLTPQTVFVSMTLFSMLRTPIASLAEATSKTMEALVGTKRIEKFLLLEEIREDDVIRESMSTRDPNAPLVSIKDGTFSWGKQQDTSSVDDEVDSTDENQPLLSANNNDEVSSSFFKPTLENINLSVYDKSLIAVVGRVGQGKSSLLSAIIGDMYKTSGTVHIRGHIAYVPQHAWILNCSLRDNILFGKDYNHQKYRHIIYACGLEPDIEMLPAGDLTEIGERGINLSGGQKQRVSLARAAYSDSDIYLLDDPLSAVDAHVDRHLWRHLIGPNGLLKNKTRILVTHGIHHLKDVDTVAVIKDGKIASQGTYSELMAEKQAFYVLIKEYALKNRRHSESGDGSVTVGPPVGIIAENRSSSGSQSETGYEDDQSSDGSLDTMEGGLAALSAEITEQKDVSNEADTKMSAKGKIIEDEKIKEGSVGWGPIMVYIRAASYKYAIWLVILHIFAQAALVGTNLWLKYWIKSSENPPDGNDTAPSLKLFLVVFTLLTTVYVAIYMIVIYVMFTKAVIRASYNLHKDLIFKIFRLPSSFFDTTPLGRIINRISGDVESNDDHLPWGFDTLLMFTTSFTATMIIVIATTPSFLLALPVFVPLVLVIQRMYLYASRMVKRIFHVTKSPIYQHFNETLGGVSTIRAMRLQDRFIAGNMAKVDINTNAHIAYTYCIRWVEIRLQCLSAVIILLITLTFVFKRDSVDPATAGLAMSFALTITQDINVLVRSYCELQNRLVPVERVKEYIDLPSEAPEILPLPQDYAGSSLTWPPEHGKIVFSNYSTRYREGLDLVLKNVSFEVQAGERLGIVGRTGAGKSSLTLALFRMIESANSHWVKDTDPTTVLDDDETENEEYGGKIEIDGVDISTLGLVDLRQELAIIPQDPILFAGSVRDNLDPFHEHSDHILWKSLERAHLKSYIQSLPGGLSFEVSQNGENFSVGQRSLICLARALLRKTKILVLDEATSAVDVETDDLIQKTIREEFRDRTILTIAHRIKTVMDSDKILVLEQGRVVEFDKPEILLQQKENSLFYRLAEQAGEV